MVYLCERLGCGWQVTAAGRALRYEAMETVNGVLVRHRRGIWTWRQVEAVTDRWWVHHWELNHL